MAVDEIACPICGQGWVVPVKIKGTDKLIYVCQESEETWMSKEDIRVGTWAELPSRTQYAYLNQVMKYLGLDENDYGALEWPQD